MLDWYDRIIVALCLVAIAVVVGVAIVGGAEPSGEEFDVVGWVANPANPASPLHPKF